MTATQRGPSPSSTRLIGRSSTERPNVTDAPEASGASASVVAGAVGCGGTSAIGAGVTVTSAPRSVRNGESPGAGTASSGFGEGWGSALYPASGVGLLTGSCEATATVAVGAAAAVGSPELPAVGQASRKEMPRTGSTQAAVSMATIASRTNVRARRIPSTPTGQPATKTAPLDACRSKLQQQRLSFSSSRRGSGNLSAGNGPPWQMAPLRNLPQTRGLPASQGTTVGAARFELATSSSQTMRATRLRHAPRFVPPS